MKASRLANKEKKKKKTEEKQLSTLDFSKVLCGCIISQNLLDKLIRDILRVKLSNLLSRENFEKRQSSYPILFYLH